ncbi:MAG TPA: zf-TFIIB domain-containing protein [Pyrinomonadaceae bacterium]
MPFSAEEYFCFRCGAKYNWGDLTTSRAGNLLCLRCVEQLENEPVRKCPVDGTEMKKQRVLDKFMVDRCPECGGTWFDKGELKVVQKAAYEAGKNDISDFEALFLR